MDGCLFVVVLFSVCLGRARFKVFFGGGDMVFKSPLFFFFRGFLSFSSCLLSKLKVIPRSNRIESKQNQFSSVQRGWGGRGVTCKVPDFQALGREWSGVFFNHFSKLLDSWRKECCLF